MKIFDEKITSRDNRKILKVASLSDKKYREKYSLFFAEGYKLFCEAVDCKLDIFEVYISENAEEKYLSAIKNKLSDEKFKDTCIYIVGEACFSKISTEKAPQGIITVIKYLDKIKKYNIIIDNGVNYFYGKKIIMLDSVRDPLNLGSVIRSAAAFGTDVIVLSSDSADLLNPKTVRSSMGSLFRMNFVIADNLTLIISHFKEMGRRVLCAELRPSAIPLSDAGITTDDIIVIGNEGHGISDTVSAVSDGSVYIPIKNGVESLNASVAAAIFIWEQGKNG